MDMFKITLSADGSVYTIPRSTACRFGMVSCALDGDPCATEMDIGIVNSTSMNNILRWLNINPTLTNDDKYIIIQPILSNDLSRILPTKDNAVFFENLTKVELFDILKASDFLYIEPLLQMAAATIAAITKGKNQQEISNVYGAHCDRILVKNLIKHNIP